MPPVPHYWGKLSSREKFAEVKLLKDSQSLTSKSFTCGNVRWMFGVHNRGNQLLLFLRCLKAHTPKDWSITADVEYCSLKNNETVGNIQKAMKSFDKREMEFDLLFDENAISDELLDKSILDIQLSLRVNESTEVKFDSHQFDNEDLADVVLKVNNREFCITKMLLEMHSDFFKAMFSRQNDGFKEAKQKEISLDDNEYDVQNFLELVTSMSELTDDTVEGLLELAEKWQAPRVLNICEHWLIKFSEKTISDLFCISLRYNIRKLEMEVMWRANTKDKVMALMAANVDIPEEKRRQLDKQMQKINDAETARGREEAARRTQREQNERMNNVELNERSPYEFLRSPPPRRIRFNHDEPDMIDPRAPRPLPNPIAELNERSPYEFLRSPPPRRIRFNHDEPDMIDPRAPRPLPNPIAELNIMADPFNAAIQRNNMIAAPAPAWINQVAAWNNGMQVRNLVPDQNPMLEQNPRIAWNPVPDRGRRLNAAPQPNRMLPPAHNEMPQFQQGYQMPLRMNMMIAPRQNGNQIGVPNQEGLLQNWNQF